MADLKHYNQRNLFEADMLLANLLGPEDLCTTIKDEISPLVKDTDFEDMYKDGGRPPYFSKDLAPNDDYAIYRETFRP